MTEATNNTEVTQEVTPDVNGAGQETPIDVRNHPAFKAVTKELSMLRAQFDKRAKEEADAKSAAEQKRLEEEGKYKESLELERGKIAEALAERDTAKRKLDLARAGVDISDDDLTNFVLMKFAASGEPELGSWLASMKEDASMSRFLGGRQDAAGVPGAPAVPGGAAAGRSTTTGWAQVKADRDGSDPVKKMAAINKVRSYFLENGTLPPGFDK